MTALVTGAPKKRSALRFELLKDVGRDLGRGEGEATYVETENLAGFGVIGESEGKEFEFFLHIFQDAAHEALGGVDGGGGVLQEGGTGGIPYRYSVLGPGYDGGDEAVQPSAPGMTTGVSPSM